MNAVAQLPELLRDDRVLRSVGESLHSALPTPTAGRYDRYATIYDRVLSSRLYNRMVWGNTPAEYRDFARQAVGASEDTWLLDAGGGSLLFTAEAYVVSKRPIVVLDRSLAMLTRARDRLVGAAGTVPEHVILLQGDLLDLPFRARSFGTILCMGVIHLFQEAAARLLADLESLRAEESRIFVMSLVTSGRVSDLYLCGLHRGGELARPRRPEQLRNILEAHLSGRLSFRVQGNMAYAIAGSSV